MGARLAEMDKLLRDIQVGLVPGRDPAPALVAPEPEPEPEPEAPPAIGAPQVQALSELSARLLASIRELLAGYERVLVPATTPPPSAPRTARHRADSPDVTMAAGPFASLEALREFEQAVSRLPGVHDVAVRGYDGTDRAIIDVRLDQPNP